MKIKKNINLEGVGKTFDWYSLFKNVGSGINSNAVGLQPAHYSFHIMNPYRFGNLIWNITASAVPTFTTCFWTSVSAKRCPDLLRPQIKNTN